MAEMADFIGDLQFAVNGKGNDPLERFPWGSRWPVDSDGQGIVVDGRPFQFFVDSDGFPVVTKDGHLVHYDDTQQRAVIIA